MANQISQEPVRSREDLKKTKMEARRQKQKEKAEKRAAKKAQKPVRLRLIPIWLRVILFLLFFAAALAGGLMVGYGVIGDGEPKDVFEKETWTHIIDIITKGT